jgi:hypothetical protein
MEMVEAGMMEEEVVVVGGPLGPSLLKKKFALGFSALVESMLGAQ